MLPKGSDDENVYPLGPYRLSVGSLPSCSFSFSWTYLFFCVLFDGCEGSSLFYHNLIANRNRQIRTYSGFTHVRRSRNCSTSQPCVRTNLAVHSDFLPPASQLGRCENLHGSTRLNQRNCPWTSSGRRKTSSYDRRVEGVRSYKTLQPYAQYNYDRRAEDIRSYGSPQ